MRTYRFRVINPRSRAPRRFAQSIQQGCFEAETMATSGHDHSMITMHTEPRGIEPSCSWKQYAPDALELINVHAQKMYVRLRVAHDHYHHLIHTSIKTPSYLFSLICTCTRSHSSVPARSLCAHMVYQLCLMPGMRRFSWCIRVAFLIAIQ